MIAYEIIMVMLTLLTVTISIIGIIVRLLLVVIDRNIKNNYLLLLVY